MLTKNLLPCKIRNGRLLPQFLSLQDESASALARDYCALFEKCEGENLQTMEQKVSGLGVDTQSLHAQAFKKLLTDRCEFFDDGGKIAERRLRLISDAQTLRNKYDFATLQNFQNEFCRLHAYKFVQDAQDLYGDLDDLRIIEKYKPMDAIGLIHRFNCGIIQGLLLQAKSIKLEVFATNVADRRLLFRRLKFFRLLAALRHDPKKNCLHMEITGPLQIFSNTQTYGLRLSSFFPHVLFLPKWQLTAEIKYKNAYRVLKIDSDLGLKSHYKWQPQYIPKEYSLFVDNFMKNSSEKALGWRVECCDTWLQTPVSGIIFPDFVFTPPKGSSVYLEILHKWHATPLQDRLKDLEHKDAVPLILAVHKSLKNNSHLQAIFENVKNLPAKILFFSEFPLANQILNVLGARK